MWTNNRPVYIPSAPVFSARRRALLFLAGSVGLFSILALATVGLWAAAAIFGIQ